MKKRRSHFYGQAGEYYALYRLWESRIVAMMAPPGARRIDLLVYDDGYKLLATAQVKTRSTKHQKGWFISRKQIKYERWNHFYIFVDLDIRTNGMPLSYVVPSKVVADLGRRFEKNEPSIAGAVAGETRLASGDKDLVDFLILKPQLDEPHPILGNHWTNGFADAYELLHLPIFQTDAANRLVPRRTTKSEG
jgi:hypothetical protein